MHAWAARLLRQLRGINPFVGDVPTSRVRLFASGRPSLPFPHFWNYRRPIRILDAFYGEADREPAGSARHNRYLDVPGMPLVLVTREPAVIHAVLANTGDKPGQFDRDTTPSAGIARATGRDSLLYANGPLWRRQKLIAAPAFSRSNLFQPEKFQEFERTFRATAHERLEFLRSRQRAAGRRVSRVRLEPEIAAVMLEMLVNNFFGGSVGYEDLRHRHVPSLTMLIDHMVSDTVGRRVRLAFEHPFRRARLDDARADFEELVDVALSGRAPGRGLWAQFKSDAPDAALRSNIRVFLAGALEATTSFASWAIAHLSRSPEVQERVEAEIRDVDVYDPENLAQAVTLNRVLEETLRLTPSLYFLPRWSTADTPITLTDGRKMLIPKATHVVLDVWHANRCEDFWGREASGFPANAFAPARWEVLAQRGRSARDILHFGFGHGPRVCPGKYLGLLEVGLVVGALVKLFRFRAVEERVEPRAGVSTKPADGVWVDLELR